MSGLRARERRRDKADSIYVAHLSGRDTRAHVVRRPSLWGPRCGTKHPIRVERGIASREELQRRLSFGRDRIEYRLSCRESHWDGRYEAYAVHIDKGDDVRIIGAPVDDDPNWRDRMLAVNMVTGERVLETRGAA